MACMDGGSSSSRAGSIPAGLCMVGDLASRPQAWIYSCVWMLVIVNPRAGRGAGTRKLPVLRQELRCRHMESRIVVTTGPGHARELARSALAEGETCVVAVGGDGTVSEVAGSLAGTAACLGIIAVGTGNDLARTLGLPRGRIDRALEVIGEKRTRQVDLGRVGDRYFVSLLGVGFPAVVAAGANRMRYLTGTAAFLLSVLRCIHRMRPASVRLLMDGREMERECTSILVQNTPYTGGGLRIAPGARLDDGQLDVVVVDDIGRLDLVWNLPKVYSGRHLGHPRFSIFRCRTVEIDASPVLEKTLDGDAFGRTPVKAEICPRALTVIARPPGVSEHD